MGISGVIAAGSTEVITRVFLYKDSGATSGTEGDPLTGLTNASSGLIIASMRDDESSVTTYTAAGSGIEDITTFGTHADPSASKVRFEQIDATNLPGWYELQWLDARWASGATEHVVQIHGATDLAAASFRYILDAVTLDDISTRLVTTDGVATKTYLDTRTLAAADYPTTNTTDGIIEDIADLTNGNTPVYANVKQINDTAVTGTGQSTDKWRA